MTDHDPLCPQRHQYRGHKSRCVCVLLTEARAEERDRWGLGVRDTFQLLMEVKFERLIRERDAARAEVAALQRILDQAHADRDAAIADAARMEMGLVDLKARVEGLRLIPIWGTSRDAYDHHTLAAVLALIEEAQP